MRKFERIKHHFRMNLTDFPFQNQKFDIFFVFCFTQRKINYSHLDEKRLEMVPNLAHFENIFQCALL